jgi:uncharacterized membrane protein
MKNKQLLGEVIISILLLILLALCSNPFGKIWMPSMLMSSALVLLIVVFTAFVIFVWKEKAHDEREEQHRLLAGRISFLCGAIVLVIGIVYQTYHGHTDNWLLIALCAMVAAKLATQIYSQLKK